jgi:virulence factor Mce-like protein
MIAATLVAVVAIGGVSTYLARADRDTRTLCADLVDSAGLYAGNAVNIRGVRIGSVTGVSPKAGGVTIRMKVDDQPLSPSLRVVAVNNSVLADRRIELVDTDPRGGAELGADSCVPSDQTYTPISVSTAFQSFTTLFEKLGGPGDDSAAPVGSLIAEADKQLVGTGGDLNQTIKNIAGFMSDPDEFLSQMRAVFDNLAVLTDVAGRNWAAITDIGKNSADLTYFMGSLFKSFVYIFNGLGEAGPGMDDLFSNVVPPMMSITDDSMPFIKVGLAGIDDLTAMIKQLPGIAASLQKSVSSRSGGIRVSVRAPRVEARTPGGSAALCAAMNQAKKGSCDPRAPERAVVDLGALVTQAIQGGSR